MAESLPDLIARLRLDMSDAQAGVGRASAIGGAIGGALGGVIANVAGAALASVRDFVTGSVDAFSQLEDSTAAAGEVFGDSFHLIEEQAAGAADSMGLSAQQVITAAQQFGIYGQSAGLAGDALAVFSTDMTGLASDLASFTGRPMEDALEAIGSGLRGEAEPLRAFGVMLDDTVLRARAMEMGIYDGNGALTQQQKVLAAQAEILAQTTTQQGDFARTAESTANVQARLSAATEDLQAKFGTLLAPAFTAARLSAIDMVSGMSGVLDTIIPKWEAFTGNLSGQLASLRELFSSGDFTADMGKTLGIEEDSPVVGVVLGLRDTLASIMESFGALWAPIADSFAAVGPSMSAVVPQIVAVVSQLSPIGMIVRAILPVLPQLAAAFGSVIAGILDAVLPLLPTITQLAAMLGGVLAGAVAQLVPTIMTLVGTLAGVFMTVLTSILPLLGMLPQILMTVLPAFMSLIPAVLSIVNALLPLIPVIAQLIGSLLPVFVTLIMQLLPPILGLVTTLVSGLAPILTAVADIIAGLLVPILTTLIGWIVQAVTWVLQFAGPVLGGLINVITAVVGAVVRIIAAIARWVASLGNIGGAVGRFVSAVSSGIGRVLGFFQSLPARAIGAIASLGGRLASTGRSALSSLGSSISSGISGVLGTLGSLPGQAISRISGMVSTFRNAGRNIIEALASGIRNAIGSATSAVSGVVDAVRDFLPFSPAKRGAFSGRGWSLYSGLSIPRDFARGIDASTSDAIAAAQRMAQGVAGVQVAPPELQSVRVATAGSGDGSTTGAGATGGRGAVTVRVFIGDRELEDIVRTEVVDTLDGEAQSIELGSV